MATAVSNFVIEQRDGKWCLLTSDGSRVLGCHDTKEEAEAQEQAIKAAEHALGDLYELRDVEIFAAGKWNGEDYTVADIDEMVRAFGQVGFTPPLKSGHTSDKPGMPALGWVSNLKRVGSKLVADLTALPKQVYDAIRTRRYNSVSAEIYTNLEKGKETFKRALKAVALLGADIPAVADLKPLHESLASGMKYEAIKTYAVSLTVPPLPVLTFTAAQMRVLCPSCADKMAELKLSQITFKADHEGHYQMPEGMLAGLCEKFGDAEGFRTWCAGADFGEFAPADRGVFCDWLKDECGLMASRTPPTQPTKETTMTLEEAQTKIKTLEEQIAQRPTKEEAAKLRSDHDALTKDVARMTEERRQDKITAATAKVKIPAFRTFVRPLYDLATSANGKVVTFSKDGKDESIIPEALVDKLVAEINERAVKLFGEHSTVTPKDDGSLEDPGAEVDRRVRKFMREKNEADYAKAMDAVLEADPDLKKSYADATA